MGDTLSAASAVGLFRPPSLPADSSSSTPYALLLDPSSCQTREQQGYCGEGTFAWDQSNRLILAHWAWAPTHNHNHTSLPNGHTSGKISQDMFWAAKALSREGVRHLAEFKRQVLQRKILYEANAIARASGDRTTPQPVVPNKPNPV